MSNSCNMVSTVISYYGNMENVSGEMSFMKKMLCMLRLKTYEKLFIHLANVANRIITSQQVNVAEHNMFNSKVNPLIMPNN